MATATTNPDTQKLSLHATDTGSPQVQISALTARINSLASHMTTHARDFNSRRGLLIMVGRRRRLLAYLKRTNEDTYRKLLDVLKLRK